jgi:hypothetical protein
MTSLRRIIAVLLLAGCSIAVPGALRAHADDANPAAALPQEKADAKDFAPGLGVFALLMVVIAVMLAVTAVVAIGMVAVLFLIGLISTSVLAGFIRKRPSAGFRVFFMQTGAVAGIVCGIPMSWLVVWLLELGMGLRWSSLGGAACGLLAGVGISLLFNSIWRRMLQRHQTTNKIM